MPRAKDYGPELKKNGFKPVNVSHSQAKAGDVVIFQPSKGTSKSGHMAIYDGKNWISDFKQKSFYVNKNYMNSSYTIYREF